MRTSHALSLAAVVSLTALGAWLGCSSDSGNSAGPDAGLDGALDAPAAPADAAQGDSAPADTEALNCDNYCARVLANCTGDAAQYADLPTCKQICADLPLGDAGDTSGDTVACRMYHAGAPAKQSPTFHCPHAGPFGGGVCGARCDSFCLLAGDQCPTSYDAGACDAACPSFALDPDAGETPTGPTSGNTLNCREYHLVAAFGAPAVHCAHITPVPAGDAAGFPCQ